VNNVQLSYINDGNKHCQLHKPPQTTMHKLTTAQTLYIITLLDSGLSGGQIHDKTGFSSATISRIRSQHRSNLPKASGGRPAKLTDYARRIIRMGKVDNAVEATKALQNIVNTPISSQTVRRQLKARGMKAVVKRKRPLLKPHHKRARMEFAERHLE
jgi:transposase